MKTKTAKKAKKTTAKKATRAPAKKRAARPKKPLPVTPSVGMLVKLDSLDQRVITVVEGDGAPYRVRYVKCVGGSLRRGSMDWQAVLAKSGVTVEEHWA